MSKKLYTWALKEANSPRALWILAGISFLEAFLLPVPIDAILAPIMIANKRKIWAAVSVASIASVFGGIVGYTIGSFLYGELGHPLLEASGHNEIYIEVADALQNRRWEFILIGATLISYEVVSITSGFAEIPLGVFILASMLARGGRFLFLGLLFYHFGPSVKNFLDRYAAIAVWIVLAFFACSLIVIRLLL